MLPLPVISLHQISLWMRLPKLSTASIRDYHSFRDFIQQSWSYCSVVCKSTTCSNSLSVVNYSDQKQHGRKRFISLWLLGHSLSSWGRNSIRSLKQKPWGTMLAGLIAGSFSDSHSATFLYSSGPLGWGIAPPTVDLALLYQLVIKKMPPWTRPDVCLFYIIRIGI